MATDLSPGLAFERDHPFTLVVEGVGEWEVERWRPGAWNTDTRGVDEALAACTAEGRVKFTVISLHRPPGYPERVFFKREFTCPDGTRYAPGKLHNCIRRKFIKDVAAFPFEYVVVT